PRPAADHPPLPLHSSPTRRSSDLAPALHGLWSTAPYLHNGSVPTVYHVLRYGERPTFWRRPLNTPGTPPDRGFDVGLAAYDFAKDRKSTRLNSSHEWISYAVFCLK